jgi:Mg2+-importing ATPase
LKSIEYFWSIPANELAVRLSTSFEGLDEKTALERFHDQQKSMQSRKKLYEDLSSLLSQYKNPLVLILVFAAGLALLLGEYSESFIILIILLLTGLLSYIQERNAGKAVEKLKALVRNKVMVKRQGQSKEVIADEVVPGDIVILDAGDIIPADAIILDANELHVNEAALTGESYPAAKIPGNSPAGASLTKIKTAVFKGTNVISGSALVMAVNTNQDTVFGKIAASVSKPPPETAFEKGMKNFGFLLMRIAVTIALMILVVNILLKRPVIDSLLFTLALAVGMTPELLPAIITITLSAGAKKMADKKVIVKKLASIQNLGEMDILCSDKTGTLTEGRVKIHAAKGYDGGENNKVLQYACLNAFFETGFSNPIDEALREAGETDVHDFSKEDEIPYDFIRKRLSVVVRTNNKSIMITKGAVMNVLSCCTRVEVNGSVTDIATFKDGIRRQFVLFSEQGLRTIGVAYKETNRDGIITKSDEADMVFLGFITLFDPPKTDIDNSIKLLRSEGIRLKIISGDNRLVVKQLAASIGLDISEIITGADLLKISEDALPLKANHVDVFAEIEPMQKERIIRALQKGGHAVGFLGDGINDAGAIKAADVGISVESAADITKEVADIVLLDKSIEVIRDGVIEGRKTFMNTLKYIFITTSANFGNMLSMAAASLVLPFLPLLAAQVLLNNFLSDIPALAIGSDNVDDESVKKPKHWNMSYIRRFMVVYGLQSSVFDLITFLFLLYYFHAGITSFRTGWFTESLITEILILLIIRTRRRLWKSRPGKWLLRITLVVLLLAICLPYLPIASYFELYPIPGGMLAGILLIAALYLISAEAMKKLVLQ